MLNVRWWMALKAWVLALLWLGGGLPLTAAAQSCPINLQIVFPDGEKGCLTDLPLARQTVKGWGRPLEDVIKYASQYSVAASATCPDVHVAVRTGPTGPTAQTQLNTQALAACDSRCECATVINNGQVLLGKSLTLALGGGGTVLADNQARAQQEKLRQQEQEHQLALQRLQEQKQQDADRARERERLQKDAELRQQKQLAQAQQLKTEQRAEEEARLLEQMRKEQALKTREEALLAQETKFREQQRRAEEARLKEEERQLQARKRQEQEQQQQASQSQASADRELLLQLAAELAKLRAQQTEQEKKNTAATPVASPTPLAPKPLEPLPVFANRKALVIGNDRYKFVSPLVNATEDARSMAESLKSVGYQVVLRLNVTEKEFKASLRQFRGQVETGDEVAFFYAGHGVQLSNTNYLVPVDVAGESEDQLRDEAIPLQRFLDDMGEKRVKFSLAMIDACRDNPFKSQGRALGGGTRGLAPTTAATGQMVVFSAGTGQQALDKLGPGDKDKNGVFTRVFIQEMQKPGVSVDRVVRSVRSEVVNLAKSIGHEQVPAIYDQTVGEFYFRAR